MKMPNHFWRLLRLILDFLSVDKFIPAIAQPLIVVFIKYILPDNVIFVTVVVAISLILAIRLSKNEFRSHFLYYWIVLSISYTIIVFEFIIVPLAEITPKENYLLIFFTVVSLIFLYLTTINSNSCSKIDTNNGFLVNGNETTSICPACGVKMEPRNFHCKICQECIHMYDHHSFWLNCCIGESNLHCYFTGILFGFFALLLASLLILTSICTPEYVFGILIPEDCTDVCSNIETCICFICGIYCMELSVVLLFKVGYHFWLISRGFSMFEWTEQVRYHAHKTNPYSPGIFKNWQQFFMKFKKIHVEF